MIHLSKICYNNFNCYSRVLKTWKFVSISVSINSATGKVVINNNGPNNITTWIVIWILFFWLLILILWQNAYYFHYLHLYLFTLNLPINSNIRAWKAGCLWRHEFTLYGCKFTIHFHIWLFCDVIDRLLFVWRY